MKSTHALFGIFVLVAIIGGFMYFSSAGTQETIVTGNAVKEGPIIGQAQEVTLGEKDYNYYPNSITVKAGQPVKLNLDKSVVGCGRSIVIKELGIQKYLKTSTDALEFTPQQKGTFSFTCSMGMLSGKLIVE